MGSRSLSCITFLVSALIVCLCAGTFAFAQDKGRNNFKDIKEQVASFETALVTAETAEREAARKLADNEAAQQKDPNNQALKREGRTLAVDADTKAEAARAARRNLAAKKGELREAASSHAVKQLSASGNVNERLTEANFALDDWKGALLALPEPPAGRDTKRLIDPDEVAAVRKTDRQRLTDYETWAAGEDRRIATELSRADELVGADKKLKDADDLALLISAAKALKTTLEQRRKALDAHRKTAKDRLAALK